jgi:hypothetical protein
MTEASRLALQGLRDLRTLEWYVIPLLAIVFFIYTSEIRKARASRNWDCVLAGATLFGADFLNETWNGWVLALTHRSALWTTPGPTALRTMVGWNIEIMFMFAILGIIYYATVGENRDERLFGVPVRWFWAVVYTVVCVIVEVALNSGGQLVWEYSFWNRSWAGIWLILVVGYFWFFAVTKFAIERKTIKGKLAVPGVLYGVAVVLNVVGAAIGLVY